MMRSPISIRRAFFLVTLCLVLSSRAFGLSVATTRKDTKVNTYGKSTASVGPPPRPSRNGDDLTLTSYMRLPVEQYALIPMPLGSSLSHRKRRIEGTRGEGAALSDSSPADTEFELIVPTLSFFNLRVQPTVFCTVRPEKDKVLILSHKCTLKGSPFIEKVKLNDRFDFLIETELTWEDFAANKSARRGRKCSISAETIVDVDVDVPPPFSSLPQRVLRATGNAAMKLSLMFILDNFVENLAKDYGKWATDEKYRSYRASLSEPSREISEDFARL